MITVLFKKALKFWREIVIAVAIGLFLIVLTKGVMQSQAMDGWDIFLVCWFAPLFLCLIGQFFWKNDVLAVFLSVFFGFSSLIVILLALIGIFYSPSYISQHIPMLIIGIACVIAAFKMFAKYAPKEASMLQT